MKLYLSDWTTPITIASLRQKGVEADRIIKVYAAHEETVRRIAGRKVQLLEANEGDFSHRDCFVYKDRGTYDGRDLQHFLSKHTSLDYRGRATARALLRFGYQDRLKISQFAMGVRNGDEWQFPHPFSFIHFASHQTSDANARLHLDIFSPGSIKKLAAVVDIDNPSKIATERDVRQIIQAESGNGFGKERI